MSNQHDGPYIVTTTVPVPGIAGAGFGGDKPPKVSRRAVATLDEARALAGDAVCLSERHGQYTQGAAFAAAWTLTPEGGTVGPLPDGTVLEVEITDDAALAADLGRDLTSIDASPARTAALCAEFNAVQHWRAVDGFALGGFAEARKLAGRRTAASGERG